MQQARKLAVSTRSLALFLLLLWAKSVMPPRVSSHHAHSGFTLVELVIVVAILALLAALAVPAFLAARERSQETRFINDLRIYRDAVEQFVVENEAPLPNSGSGTVAAQLVPYMDVSRFTGGNIMNGEWDLQSNATGVSLAVGSHQRNTTTPKAITRFERIDAVIDDGDLSSGGFRRIATDRFYWVLAD